MADLEERVLLSVDLDVSLLNESAAEAVTNIKRIKEEQKALEAAGQQATVQYRQNAQALSLYNKQLNDAAKALAINEQQTKSNTGSLADQRQQLIAATLQYKLYSDEAKKNSPVAIALAADIKALSDNIKEQELALGNATRNVGNYAEAVDPLKAQVIGLRQEHRQLTTTMHGALGIFALLNLASGEGAEASKAQKAALVGLVAMQAISQIRMGALAAAQLTNKAASIALTAATGAQTAATGALARMQTFLVNQFHLSAAAARVLSIALAATGIGLIVLALIALTTYAASAATATEDLADKTDGLTKSLSENEIQIAKLAFEYLALTGAITELEKELEILALDNQAAVSKIEKDSKGKLESTTNAWATLADGFYDFLARRRFGSTQLLEIDKIESDRDKKRLDEVNKYNLERSIIEQKYANKKAETEKQRAETEAKKAEEQAKKLAEIEAKWAEATAIEKERIKVLLAEREFRFAVEQLEKEIAARKAHNASLEVLYDTDAENLGNSIDKMLNAQTRALRKRDDDEDKARSENLEKATQYVNDLGRIGDALFDFTSTVNQNEIDALEDKHRRGLISEKEYNRQIAEMRRKQAESEKRKALFDIAIATAVAIVKAFPNVALMVIAAALGVAEGIVVASRKIPETPSFAKGGVIGGKPHSQGGTKFYGEDGTQFEAERGELITVINKNSTAMLGWMSRWNQAGGGVAFEKGGIMKYQDGGFASRVIASQALNQFDMSGVVNAIADMNIFVRVSEINEVQNRVQVIENNRRV